MKNGTCTALVVLLLWMILSAAPARAQQSAAPANPLEPLARAIGNWRGQIKLLDGTVIDARNVFASSLDGKAILFRAYGITKEGERHVYDGLYGWHPQQQRIVLREQSAYGALIDGTVEPEGDALVFTWTQYGAKGTVEYRETFRFPDPDTYVTEVFRKTDKGWERFTLENRFVREKETAAAPAGWQRSLRKQVTVAAPLAEVWNAWTTTEGVTGFFAPAAKVEARIGGPYEIYFGLSQPEGQRGSEGCKVHSVVPMKLLAFEWNAPPSIPTIRDSGVHTLVVIELEEAGPKQTRVTMTHTGWGVGEDWDKTYAYFDRAWEAVLSNLQYRFEVGRVEWPGHFIRAERQAKP
ncbi:MAG TPA: SRPBCC domain-containing protein [Candidatus Xenobia bacterium]|nr:SRPBCC domain-containing protein [Candidatus Xenobia bacterium]